MIGTTAGVIAFAAETIGLMLSVLILLSRGFRRYWASVAVLTTVAMAALIFNAPIVFVVAIVAQLVLIIGTTSRTMWGRSPMGPQ